MHRAAEAKMVDFGGWEMPLAFSRGTVAEHLACRTAAVAFDVSHLGTVRVAGRGALDHLNRVLTNDLHRVAPGRAQYTHLLDAKDASVLDDLIVWWVGDDRFHVMPNASNTERVIAALTAPGLDVTDTTGERAVIAVQGPRARHDVRAVVGTAVDVRRFGVQEFTWGGERCLVAGTGYTGEDGVEFAVPVVVAESFWSAVLETGIQPAGLGARDTLRLEAALPLHGHELGPGITPLQAGLGWVVAWDKGAFQGRDALERERAQGVRRRLRGLETAGRQPARQGCPVIQAGTSEPVGVVTSGNYSPTLGHGIALAFLPPNTEQGTHVSVDVRGRPLDGRVVAVPFVKKAA
jgi:aminomethyltransferase